MVWRRLPSYALGLLIGLSLLLVISRAKKEMAPVFTEQKLESPAELLVQKGGWLHLDFLGEPGLKLPPGFPSQIWLSSEDGTKEFGRLNYRQITGSQKHRLPLPQEEGRWRLEVVLYACTGPGEKYCAKIVGKVPVRTIANGAESAELPIDLGKLSEEAARVGASEGVKIY